MSADWYEVTQEPQKHGVACDEKIQRQLTLYCSTRNLINEVLEAKTLLHLLAVRDLFWLVSFHIVRSACLEVTDIWQYYAQ